MYSIARKSRTLISMLARIMLLNWLRCLLYRLAGVKIGKNVFIDMGAVIRPGTRIGYGCHISSHAKISEGVTLGREVTVNSYTFLSLVEVGDNSSVERGVVLLGGEEHPIQIGRHTYIGMYAVLEGFGGLRIGNHVHIAGPSASIWTHTSIYECLRGDRLDDHTHRRLEPIEVEDNVWIGGKVTLYPGVTIGHHSVILPNSVIDTDIAAYSLAGGVPAKILKQIKTNENHTEFLL